MLSRKFICTLSLFLVALGLFVGSWFIQMPDYINSYIFHRPITIVFPIWLCTYVGMPLLLLGLEGLIIQSLWRGCALLCANLRGEKPNV